MGIDHEALSDGIRFIFKGYNDKLPVLVLETFQKIKDLKKYQQDLKTMFSSKKEFKIKYYANKQLE
jgi:hypothetical protein